MMGVYNSSAPSEPRPLSPSAAWDGAVGGWAKSLGTRTLANGSREEGMERWGGGEGRCKWEYGGTIFWGVVADNSLTTSLSGLHSCESQEK